MQWTGVQGTKFCSFVLLFHFDSFYISLSLHFRLFIVGTFLFLFCYCCYCWLCSSTYWHIVFVLVPTFSRGFCCSCYYCRCYCHCSCTQYIVVTQLQQQQQQHQHQLQLRLRLQHQYQQHQQVTKEQFCKAVDAFTSATYSCCWWLPNEQWEEVQGGWAIKGKISKLP